MTIRVVVYHGRRRWNASRSFAELFDLPEEGLSVYVPGYGYILYDLSSMLDEEIRGSILLRVSMLLLKYIFDDSINKKIGEIFELLKIYQTES